MSEIVNIAQGRPGLAITLIKDPDAFVHQKNLYNQIETFLRKHAVKKLSKNEMASALKLLEMQRNAMLMYTSCGWFFDDISGIETIQIMQYALKAIQYIEDVQGLSLNPEYLKVLCKAQSNTSENTLEIYRMFVETARSDLLRVGTHYCISSVFEEYPEESKISPVGFS